MGVSVTWIHKRLKFLPFNILVTVVYKRNLVSFNIVTGSSPKSRNTQRIDKSTQYLKKLQGQNQMVTRTYNATIVIQMVANSQDPQSLDLRVSGLHRRPITRSTA